MKKIIATTLFVTILLSCSLNVNAAGLKDIFSANYYADSYDDLYAAFEYDGIKLYRHVQEYGLKEGRDVSPILDVVYYRETYPDLNAAFGDNWDAYVKHYFEYGIKEGRDNGTNFDIIRYVNSYADLREAFDEDYEALAKHYIKYGMKENRILGLKPQVEPETQEETPSVLGTQVSTPLVPETDKTTPSESETEEPEPEPIYYEEIIYNNEGRIERIEIYSDSEKTTLVSYQQYMYMNEIVTMVGNFNAQDELQEVEIYQNGILGTKIIGEGINFSTGGVNTGTIEMYDAQGNVLRSARYDNGIKVESTEYHENGNVYEYFYFDPLTGSENGCDRYYPDGQMSYQRGYNEDGYYFVKKWYNNGTLIYHRGYDQYGYFVKEWDSNGILLNEERGETEG